MNDKGTALPKMGMGLAGEKQCTVLSHLSYVRFFSSRFALCDVRIALNLDQQILSLLNFCVFRQQFFSFSSENSKNCYWKVYM